MAIVLPYEFDTSSVVKLILRGVLGVLLVVLLGILFNPTSGSVSSALRVSPTFPLPAPIATPAVP